MVRPGRLPYTDGMRLGDVLHSYRDMLPEPAAHGEVVRLVPPDLHAETIEFNVPDVLIGDANLDLQPYDTVRIFGRYQIDAPKVSIQGEVLRPGAYPLSKGHDSRATGANGWWLQARCVAQQRRPDQLRGGRWKPDRRTTRDGSDRRSGQRQQPRRGRPTETGRYIDGPPDYRMERNRRIGKHHRPGEVSRDVRVSRGRTTQFRSTQGWRIPRHGVSPQEQC